uniref:PPPDE domain-containing protein n=1 Tax=Kalanchoe fedtschenkoi TaxID=63787 RepID=A0A7N0UGS9_KALFE
MAEDGYKVLLNVYDLSQGLARQLSTTFLGKAIEAIWHTGVVVYGREYYFGGGIQNAPAGSTPYGTPLRVVDLGVTHVPQDVFEQYLQEISPRFTAETYSLLSHNCNNFSNEIAQFLVGTGIPDYILQLPNEVLNSPMGAMILPMIQNLESTLRAGAVPQVPQFRPAAATQSPMPTASISLNRTSASTPVTASKAAPASVTNGVKSEQSATNGTSAVLSAVKPEQSPLSEGGVKDPLGDARSKIQGEIAREFAALMGSGSMSASEAASLATKKVMQKYGHLNKAAS